MDIHLTAVHGRVFVDANGNGKWDQGEAPVTNARVCAAGSLTVTCRGYIYFTSVCTSICVYIYLGIFVEDVYPCVCNSQRILVYEHVFIYTCMNVRALRMKISHTEIRGFYYFTYMYTYICMNVCIQGLHIDQA